MEEEEGDSQQKLFEQKKIKEENDAIARILKPYSTFLVKYPSVIIIITVIIVIFASLLGVLSSLGAKDLPDFTDPEKGFEPRGTAISSRKIALNNLATSNEVSVHAPGGHDGIMVRKRRSSDIRELDLLEYLQYSTEDFVMVYEHDDKADLFGQMKGVCSLYEDYVINFPLYSEYFSTSKKPHHIPNYIALYNNKASCMSINATEEKQFANLLRLCLPFYKTGQLKRCAEGAKSTSCFNISESRCTNHTHLSQREVAAMFYNSYFYFVDKAWISSPDSAMTLTASIDFVNTWGDVIKEDFFTPFYNKYLLDPESFQKGPVRIVAFDMERFKFYLFQGEILKQSMLIITAIVLVVLFIWYFSGSLFIGIMTLACIVFAMVVAYFVYGRIFNMHFFPFLNMVTLIFLVGIGADDAFVYTGIWEEAKQIYVIDCVANEVEYLIKWTTHSLRHAVLAMLITSLTTAAAFYSNITSDVTSVKCFGLFAGTAIIVNYLLMVTLFPAVVILHEKYFKKCMSCCCPCLCKASSVMPTNEKPKALYKLQTFVSNLSEDVFNRYLPIVLKKLRYLWLVVCAILGVGGLLVTFWKPGLQLPLSGEFQMFSASSTLEQYSLSYKKRFLFTNAKAAYTRNVEFVFGIEAVDNGYAFNPDDTGSLQLMDEPLDFAADQLWLRDFCRNIEMASFLEDTGSCAEILYWFHSLEATCPPGQSECCNRTLPYGRTMFNECFAKGMRTGSMRGIRFDKKGDARCLVLDMATVYPWTEEYGKNDEIFETVERWLNIQVVNATTRPFKDGWWYIPQTFYDLQKSLFEGTKTSLAIAILVAFIVILLTTWNLLLSLYSIITIGFVISVTVGVLVLSGWHLNVMESVVFSVAAGLSADFTLHYSVAYRTSIVKSERIQRTLHSLSHIGPAILMGAFTTFFAGLVMFPSTVLVYIQMSQFLMLIMFVSWTYSTFFFLPLCMTIGPIGNTGQLTCSKLKRGESRRLPVPMEQMGDNNIVYDENVNNE